MIKVREVTKRFRDVVAVSNASFDVPAGAVTGLLGANGAGKTTVLKMIAGILNPDRGEIFTSNASGTSDEAGVADGLGSLLDHRGLYSRLTARENLTYFARLRGMSPQLTEQRVEKVITGLGLDKIADRRTAGFSEGERMKVALGRAMVHGPHTLILDEPTNGLDVPTVKMLREELLQLAQSGTCVLFSSHVLAEVENLCDRIVLMAGGTVVGCGSPKELMNESGTTSLEDAFLALTTDNERHTSCAA